MYSGIVTVKGEVAEILDEKELRTLRVEVPLAALHELKVGASVAIDGCCLTVEHFDVQPEGGILQFVLGPRTLSDTTLGSLKAGDLVHVERSLRLGDENGGHQVSGHIHATGQIVDRKTESHQSALELAIEVPSGYEKYLIPKGFVAVAGASLTVHEVDDKAHIFRVSLIPETLRQTKFSHMQPGDRVNLEFEQMTVAMVEVMERTLSRLLKPQA